MSLIRRILAAASRLCRTRPPSQRWHGADELFDVTSLAESAPSVLKGTQDSQPLPGRESASSDRKHPRPVAGEVLGPRVLEALGLPIKGVLGFSLHFEAGGVVRARVEFTVDREAQLEPLLREFVLVPR